MAAYFTVSSETPPVPKNLVEMNPIRCRPTVDITLQHISQEVCLIISFRIALEMLGIKGRVECNPTELIRGKGAITEVDLSV